jgi:flagellar motor switch/type III secretory pathway protein FliN
VTEEEQVAHLADVPVEVRAEIERGVVRYRDLLTLSVGAVIPTSRPANDCLDLLVGECRIGAGEVLIGGGRTVIRLLSLTPRK